MTISAASDRLELLTAVVDMVEDEELGSNGTALLEDAAASSTGTPPLLLLPFCAVLRSNVARSEDFESDRGGGGRGCRFFLLRLDAL